MEGWVGCGGARGEVQVLLHTAIDGVRVSNGVAWRSISGKSFICICVRPPPLPSRLLAWLNGPCTHPHAREETTVVASRIAPLGTDSPGDIVGTACVYAKTVRR